MQLSLPDMPVYRRCLGILVAAAFSTACAHANPPSPPPVSTGAPGAVRTTALSSGDAATGPRAEPKGVGVSAAKAEPVFFEPPAGVPLVAALQKGSCFGSCPIYSVRVFEDGTVIYRGDWHVRVRGGRKAKLSPAEMDALRGTFRRAKFFDLPYECKSGFTDHPTVRIFFADRGKTRLLAHYHGCTWQGPHGPLSPFTALENEVDRILGTARWVGDVDEGPVDLGALEGELVVPGVPVEPPDL